MKVPYKSKKTNIYLHRDDSTGKKNKLTGEANQ